MLKGKLLVGLQIMRFLPTDMALNYLLLVVTSADLLTCAVQTLESS